MLSVVHEIISSAVNNKRAPPSTPSSLKFVIIVSASFKERPVSQVATSQCVSGEEKPNEKDDPSEGDWRTSVSFFPTNQPLFPSQKKRTNLQRGRRGTRGRGSPLGLLCCSHLAHPPPSGCYLVSLFPFPPPCILAGPSWPSSWLCLLGPLLGPYVLADASLHSYHPPVKKKEGEKKETKQHKETKIKPREKSPVRLPFL